MPRYVVVTCRDSENFFFGRFVSISTSGTVVLKNARVYTGQTGYGQFDNTSIQAIAFSLASVGPKPGTVSASVPRLSIGISASDPVVDVTEAARAAWECSGTCDIRLVSAGANKIAAIKAIREITGLDLKGAKDLVESTATNGPQIVLRSVVPDRAKEHLQLLREAGATVDLVPSP